jgi:23S rRNA (pseudouridine1915-N3)-methyltransferase
MKIRILAIGKVKEEYLLAAIKEYSKRISAFADLEIVEITEAKLSKENNSEIQLAIDKESNMIINSLNKKDYNILLDIGGKDLDSLKLAQHFASTQQTNSSFTFIIGGSHGVNDLLKKSVNLRLSFSKLTFPHQLVRVMLLEQIYRFLKINNNQMYHK